MILTDKAREDFKDWLLYDYAIGSEVLLYKKEFINTLIIEWFDSVGIYILPKRFTHCLEFEDWYFIITNKQGVHLNNYCEDRINIDSRQETTKQAIIKANKIYNETHI